MFKWLAGVVFALFLMMGTAHAATTYYIDYTNGSDTNNGTSKATPWKHAPGMNGCSSNCASYTGVGGGDTWVMKGCVTWPAASLPWVPTYSAEIAAVSTGGLDQTWWDNTVSGCSTSWNRPIVNPGGVSVSSGCLVDLHNFGINLSYVEFTGGYFDATHFLCYLNTIPNQNNSPLINYGHLYMHGITYAGTSENCVLISGNSQSPNGSPYSVLHDSVIDLSDSVISGHTVCYSIYGGPPNIYNTVINDVSNGPVVNASLSVYSNNITNIGPSIQSGYHGNGFEDNSGGPEYFYNNVIAHMGAGGVTLWVAPLKGETAYVWNNVIWDTQTSNVLDLAPSLPPSGGCPGGQTGMYCTEQGTYNLYNNTVECGPDSNPVADCADGISVPGTMDAVNLINNHLITGSATPIVGCDSPCVNNSLVQSKTTANGQGYSSSETYVFSPTSNSGSTVGAGTNLTTTATGPLASLANDTSYACSEVSSPYITVSCPSRSQNPRPSSGNWDIGAYQYPSSSTPGAPSSVSGTNGGSVGAHTVTVTWSPSITSGATYFIYRGATSGGESNTPLNMSGVGTSCTSPSGGCTYTDSTVIAGQTLYYIVKAMTGDGFSVASNEINMVVPVSAPSGLVITGVH